MPLAFAVGLSTAIVLSAPFMGQVREWMFATFRDSFVLLVGTGVASAIGGSILAAFVRIRDRRRLRYGAIAAALMVGTAYSVGLSTGIGEVDAVERVHFVEYGLIALLFLNAWRPRGDLSIFILTLMAGVIVGACEEWLQWFIPGRVGEGRDIALNLVAVTCGLLFGFGASPPEEFSWRLRPGSREAVGVAASAALLAVAVFVHSVHLGYIVSTPETGSFRSRYTADELRALAADRAARWRLEPPLTFQRLSREDQYMDEGLWHVRERNDASEAGDTATASGEQRILENFFQPVLQTPSYVSKTGHQWSVERRAAVPPRGTGYVSRAEPLPIFLWSKLLFWLVVGTCAAALAAPAVIRLATVRSDR